ncbi:uncharacterized protein C8Q71DRAFT_904406 [Rhodofomes roseus]|uniref:Uncharacterized protein n=1 Tax=Rhodofomes roseus TaxID=34475 RepID=A0ABQ8KSH5_9APHY|nr:uncharacterized protein C8Q71DRAFT_904406 [Rhodofomes roseus]KAH9841667.1 hypothetical protein C8Q71DRAFT_904406 [Rhodofomes roseus]
MRSIAAVHPRTDPRTTTALTNTTCITHWTMRETVICPTLPTSTPSDTPHPSISFIYRRRQCKSPHARAARCRSDELCIDVHTLAAQKCLQLVAHPTGDARHTSLKARAHAGMPRSLELGVSAQPSTSHSNAQLTDAGLPPQPSPLYAARSGLPVALPSAARRTVRDVRGSERSAWMAQNLGATDANANARTRRTNAAALHGGQWRVSIVPSLPRFDSRLSADCTLPAAPRPHRRPHPAYATLKDAYVCVPQAALSMRDEWNGGRGCEERFRMGAASGELRIPDEGG